MSQFRNPAEPHRRLLAGSFYAAHCPKSAGEISYIDFFYPVRIIAIPKGTRLWGFKDPRVSPLHRFNTFFTIPGTDVCILGVHDSGTLSFKDHKTQQVLQLNPKVTRKSLNEYEVMTEIPAVLLIVAEQCSNPSAKMASTPGPFRENQNPLLAEAGSTRSRKPIAIYELFPQRLGRQFVCFLKSSWLMVVGVSTDFHNNG